MLFLWMPGWIVKSQFYVEETERGRLPFFCFVLDWGLAHSDVPQKYQSSN